MELPLEGFRTTVRRPMLYGSNGIRAYDRGRMPQHSPGRTRTSRSPRTMEASHGIPIGLRRGDVSNRTWIAGIAGLAALAIAGCSGDSEEPSTTSGVTATATATVTSTATAAATPKVTSTAAGAATPTATATSSATAGAASTSGALQKVNANTATVAQIQAALEAAGVSNASRWAREVEEYRPYPADPTWARLRQELAKYNPGPGVVDQIISVLEQ